MAKQQDNSRQMSRNRRVNDDVQQLKQLVPGLNNGNNVSQAEVMHEAARYIDHLQNNLICHIRTHGYPDKLRRTGGQNQDSDSIRRTVEEYIVNNKWMK